MRPIARRITLYRVVSGPDDAAFHHRVSEALSRGWLLHGGPTLGYDPQRAQIICAQAIVKEVEAEYSPDLDLSTQ